MKFLEEDIYTYHDLRKCRYSKCGAPIADQAHATRLFCAREELPDGTIRNCKDDYWSEIKKQTNSVFHTLESFHKLMEERLAHFFELNLPDISLDVIEQTGIELCKSLIQITKDDTSYFYFINYAVTYQLPNKNFKIIQHENNLF